MHMLIMLHKAQTLYNRILKNIQVSDKNFAYVVIPHGRFPVRPHEARGLFQKKFYIEHIYLHYIYIK